MVVTTLETRRNECFKWMELSELVFLIHGLLKGEIASRISSASNPQKEGASAASARAFESGKFKWGKSATLTVGNSNDKLGARVKCEASHPDTISANRWEKPLEIACKLRQNEGK